MFLPVTAMSLGLHVLILGGVALLLAFVGFVILMGWQLFQYASRRVESEKTIQTAGANPDVRARIEAALKDRETLFALDHQTWQLDRDKLRLTGHYFPAPSDKKDGRFQEKACVILVHGWQDVHYSRSPAALAYHRAGFAVFMPLLRGHGESGGKGLTWPAITEKTSTPGWTESARRRARPTILSWTACPWGRPMS